MAQNKPFLVLLAGDLKSLVPGIYARAGGYEQLYARATGLNERQFVTINLKDPSLEIPAPEDFAAIFISGSGSMVTERTPWMKATNAWLIRAASSGTPILGICFGHQLLADALGGKVDFADEHRYETVAVTLTPEGQSDRLLSALPLTSTLQATHSQVITEAPRGATILARSDTGIYAARFAENVWGVQFHPEYDPADMRDILEELRPMLSADGVNADKKIAWLKQTPDGPKLMRRFCGIALANS